LHIIFKVDTVEVGLKHLIVKYTSLRSKLTVTHSDALCMRNKVFGYSQKSEHKYNLLPSECDHIDYADVYLV
jgi:hypothetical protein